MSDRALSHERAPRPAARQPEPARQTVRAYDQPQSAPARPGRLINRETERSATRQETPGPAHSSDGYWFRQWVDASQDSLHSDTGGAGPLTLASGLEGGDVEAFVDGLSSRLRSSLDQHLQMVLHLPHMGRIHVTARRTSEHWNIDLIAETEEAHGRLASRIGDCEDALADSLDQPVTLSLRRGETQA